MTSEVALETAVDQVGDLLDTRIGLRPQSTLRGRLRRSIRDEATASGEDLEGYVERLPTSGGLMQSLVNRVTVQESGFFRHPDHFEVLAADILPGFTPPVTIWSAGCANGQEAYSLVMVLEEQGIEGSVLATDLSTSALERTVGATYDTREITGLSTLRRRRHLTRDGDQWTVNESLRARVATMQHNLLDGLPARVPTCQVVFCRNVLIYFSPEHTVAFLDRVAAALTPGAYLFLGAAESLWHVTDRFEPVQLGKSFAYRRRGEAAGGRSKARASIRPPARSLSPRPRPTLLQAAPPLEATRTALPEPPREDRQPSGRERGSSSLTAAQEVGALAHAGRRAFDAGENAAAVVEFRKWAYLAPDDPMSSLHLALALEAGGHHTFAQRAFGVARAAALRGGASIEAIELGGYSREELVRLLESKQVREG
jgi:chemotaxis protein methyltransferase CheR